MKKHNTHGESQMLERSAPFNFVRPTPPFLFIDRKEELEQVKQFLLADESNVNVYGERAIGKTSFLGRIEDEISKIKPEALVIHIYLYGYLQSGNIDLSRLFLLSIADVMWAKFFNTPYSELLNLVGQPEPASASFNKKKQAFIKIYKLLRSGTIISDVEETNEIGGELVLSGKKGEKHSSQYRIEELYQFEFSNLLSELIFLLGKQVNPEIIMMVDEANYLCQKEGEQLLSRNFNILSDGRIRYVFVTLEPAKETFGESRHIFQKEIQLCPFAQETALDELINVYCAEFSSSGLPVLEFSKAARQAIWEHSLGYPYEMQILCYFAWCEAKRANRATIDSSDVIASLKHMERRPLKKKTVPKRRKTTV
jgi:hypothetical protein